jgi:hypothetical protein
MILQNRNSLCFSVPAFCLFKQKAGLKPMHIM